LDDLIASDAELAWSIAHPAIPSDVHDDASHHFVILWKGRPCFWRRRNEIRCDRPNEDQLAKMTRIAMALDANVVGHDGREYH
jgi:hypothetical protein